MSCSPYRSIKDGRLERVEQTDKKQFNSIIPVRRIEEPDEGPLRVREQNQPIITIANAVYYMTYPITMPFKLARKGIGLLVEKAFDKFIGSYPFYIDN